MTIKKMILLSSTHEHSCQFDVTKIVSKRTMNLVHHFPLTLNEIIGYKLKCKKILAST